MIKEYGAVGEMRTDKGKLPLCPPQITHNLT
jgi:hypothetical protein